MKISLTLVNTAFHEAIDAALVDTYEALLALDLDAARTRWRRLNEGLAAHMEVEERLVFPRWEALEERPPRSPADLYTRDHELVRRRLRDVSGVMAELALMAPEGRRRFLAQQLEPLVRLRGVLEHHGGREDEQLYPWLEARLPTATVAELSQALLAVTRTFMDAP